MTAEEIIQRMDRDRLRLDENETTFSQTADDRGTWRVWTNDPIWVRRLLKKGATLVSADEYGAAFDLMDEQISLRNPISEEQRAKMRERGREAAQYLP